MLTPRQTVATAALILWPRLLFAWSANGHRTIARIAQDRLSPAASQAVAGILGPGITLDQIAACADDIRGQQGFDCAGLQLNPEPQSQPWHFIDIPISDSPRTPSDLSSYCSGGGCVVDQIRAQMKVLQDQSLSRPATDKQIALMFLVHFVGDEHQPLHCANEIVNGVNDRGGNLKTVTWAGAGAAPDPLAFRLNLHSVWDHLIAPTDGTDPVALSAKLESDLQGKDTSSWTSGDFTGGAALESFSIAKDRIYPAYYAPGGSKITAAYQDANQPLAYERLEKAGVRLAALLEQALAGRIPGASAPPKAQNAPTIDLKPVAQPDW